MTLKRIGLLASTLAFAMLVFAGFNTAWTAVDGKPRAGSGLSTVWDVLAKLPNPFRNDPSVYLLPPLPDIDGWERREIADPWTVRPIKLDGTIPTDAEMREWLARKYPGEEDPIPVGLNTQRLKDRRARADGAKRNGANYTDGTISFNVVIERLPDPDAPVDPRGLGPMGLVLYGSGSVLDFAYNLAQRRTVIAGVPFTRLNGTGEGTQQSDRSARTSLESVQHGHALRIWGDGDDEDVERLLTAFRAIVEPHPLTKDLE